VPHRGWQLRIADIIEAIEAVQDYCRGVTYESFASDRRTIDAVVRNFIIIGEAQNAYLRMSLKRTQAFRGGRCPICAISPC
jgi:uncharacterized protein with HEPN domain